MRCVECGRESEVEAHAIGWIAFRVDLPDDDDPPEVIVYCPDCAAREFGSGTDERESSSEAAFNG
jgi:hypothetical protein